MNYNLDTVCWLLHYFSFFFNIVAVDFICDHPAIKAISFVGSNQAGEYIYERGSKNGKRVQSNMVGSKHNALYKREQYSDVLMSSNF